MNVMMSYLTWCNRTRAQRRKDLTRGESLPTIAIDIPMPQGVKPTRTAREALDSTTTLEEWLRTDRGRFYQTVGREIYSAAWENLTDAQRDYIGVIADIFATALGVTWTSRGSCLRRERG